MRERQYVMVAAPRPNPLLTLCFQNGGPLRKLDLEKASTYQTTPALQATVRHSCEALVGQNKLIDV